MKEKENAIVWKENGKIPEDIASMIRGIGIEVVQNRHTKIDVIDVLDHVTARNEPGNTSWKLI